MTTSTRSGRHAHRAFRAARASAVLLGVATTSILVGAPVAQAASASPSSASGICSKVSTAAVSAVVGYTLPAPTAESINLPATKKNDGISSATTSCTYGKYTLAALPKDIILDYAVTSKALTPAEVKSSLAEAQKIKMTIVPYHGLGIPAYYYTFSDGAIPIQGITGIDGVKEYGAAVYTKTMSKTKLADLVQLAEKL